jgi:hypothetical protein
VLHPGHHTGEGPANRVVLVREGLAAWIKTSRPALRAADPPMAAIPCDVPSPAGGIADVLVTLILSLSPEAPHA